MRQRVRILIVSLGIVLLLGGMGITLRAVWKPERIIQGKRENEWIRSLTNVARAAPWPEALDRSSDLHRAWEKLGPEATPILVKAATYHDGSAARAYARIWKAFPSVLRNSVPRPVDYSQFRQAGLAMMVSFGVNTQIPPALLLRTIRDTNWPVRANTISVLENRILPLSGNERDIFLPSLVAATQDSALFVRMTAVYCLRYYSNHTAIVWPHLMTAMKDTDGDVRLRAAEAAYWLDHDAASRAGALGVASDCLNYRSFYGANALAEKFLKEIGAYDERFKNPQPAPRYPPRPGE